MPNGGLQSTILRAVLGKNGFYFQKHFQKLWIFVQTRSKKSISSVFFWFVICVIKITHPIWNFLQILWPFPEFLSKIDIPFSEFFLENVTLTRGTPPCTPHMEVPPPPPPGALRGCLYFNLTPSGSRDISNRNTGFEQLSTIPLFSLLNEQLNEPAVGWSQKLR